MRYLTSENAVTASIHLYRKRFKPYLKISLISYLWFLIPIYGWAKFYAGLALISRLAFSEITGKTESIPESQGYVNPRMWKFLLAALLATLGIAYRTFLWSLVWSAGLALLSFFGFAFFRNVITFNYIIIGLVLIIVTLLTLLMYAGFFFKILEIYAPFFIYELPLALEEDMTSSKTISRSRQLIEGLRKPIIKTIVIPTIMTLPLIFLSSFVWGLVTESIKGLNSNNVQTFNSEIIEQALWLIYWIGFSILTTPFWQILKSIVYYNLRCQKEALDLPVILSSPIGDDSSDFTVVAPE